MGRLLWLGFAGMLLFSAGCHGEDCPLCSAPPETPASPMRVSSAIEAVPRDAVWTWVTVEGTRCGQSAAATGVVVNKAAGDPAGLVVFLTGGGACWDQLSCETLQTASYLDGFEPQDWADIEKASVGAGHFGYFDRDLEKNPFRNHDLVFIPYCTGDMHAGHAEVHYPDGHEMHHVGYRNYTRFLEAIVQADPHPKEVVLAGGSAGSFGAIWNFSRTQAAFGEVPVHLLADSGMPFGREVFTDDLQQKFLEAWGQDQTVPQACGAGCSDARFDSVFRYDVAAHAGSRFALVSSVADQVQRMFMAFGFEGLVPPLVPEDEFTAGLAAIAEDLQDDPNARVFFVDGAFERVGEFDWVNYREWHVFWKTEPGNRHIRVSGSDAELCQWLEAFLQGSADWQDVIPEGMPE